VIESLVAASVRQLVVMMCREEHSMCSDESIKTIYDEVCRRHDGIADFRAKLLTLLPIASGAGLFLLVAKDATAPEVLPHLLPIGVFGVLVTLGLFFYELRGIQECNALIRAARKLEEKLLPDLWRFGAFNFKQQALLYGTVGATGAALVIYPAVVGAWVYVAAVGAVGTLDPQPRVSFAAVAGACSALLLGLVVDQRQGQLLKDSEASATTASTTAVR
jgi:hypothetical protein